MNQMTINLKALVKRNIRNITASLFSFSLRKRWDKNLIRNTLFQDSGRV